MRYCESFERMGESDDVRKREKREVFVEKKGKVEEL